MKYRFYYAILVVVLVWALVGCTEELALDLSSTDVTLDESDIVEASIAVSINNFSVHSEGSTRTEEPSEDVEIMTDFEKQVDNMWVFQYNTSGELLIKPRYYTAADSEMNGTWSVLLKPYVESTIYVITNVSEGESWATEYSNFSTIEKLQASTLPAPYSIYNLDETSIEGHIPAQGASKVTVSPSETVIVPVEHMYAKVKVRVIIDRSIEQYNPSISYVVFQNSPYYCRVTSLYDGDDAASKDSNYGTNTDDWGEYSLGTGGEGNNINDPNNEPLIEAGEETFDYVIYVPENIQGEQGDETATADTKDVEGEKLAHASKVVVDLLYYNSQNVEASRHYTVYPGGNTVDNFNIRRNQVYRVTLRLGYPIEDEVTPSANCIVGHPNSTISFEPYYRTDEGGNYSFSDYLNPDDETKQIKGIKILWQTEDCIGDNSKGDLVYLVASEPQDLHDKIYVTTNQPGNAVIAAYNDEDCMGDILWSWHIWVTEEDPTNIGNAITYYTYRWDSSTIYGYDSGESRVPGYGCMPCNLGSLKSVPDGDSVEEKVATYGLLYQWGRKDPFPGLKGSALASDNDGYAYYNESTTELLYDNSNERISGMTEGERTSSNELFYSVTATTIQENGYGVDYTIKNPTVFMCGTLKAGQRSNNYVGGGASVDYDTFKDNYMWNGGWMEDQPDDLWGALPNDEATEILAVGTDTKTNETVSMRNTYGDKSIFDPCPYGWRVSPPDQWLGFTRTGFNPSSYSEINTTATSATEASIGMYLYIQTWKSGLTAWFPTQGSRVPDGSGARPRRCGNYHNVTADENNRVNILHIHDNLTNFNIFEFRIFAYHVKATAGPVRCVRDSK